MKKVIILLIVLIVGFYFSTKYLLHDETSVIKSDMDTKYVVSEVLNRVVAVEEAVDTEEEKEIEEEPEEDEEEPVVEEKKTVQPVISNDIVASVAPQNENEKLTGKMSAYGPDCSGCSGYLASGRYVGDGNIYYNDATYGNLRIVAGDSKYSFGTVVKITDKTGEFLAIVLDRGGVGLNRKYMFDLLFRSEEEASIDGISNATFEIIRYGY